MGDGVGHEISDDNDARHVVLTSSRKHMATLPPIHMSVCGAAGKNLTVLAAA